MLIKHVKNNSDLRKPLSAVIFCNQTSHSSPLPSHNTHKYSSFFFLSFFQIFSKKRKEHGYCYNWNKMWNLTKGKFWAAPRTLSSTAIYINGEFRSIIKIRIGIRIYSLKGERDNLKVISRTISIKNLLLTYSNLCKNSCRQNIDQWQKLQKTHTKSIKRLDRFMNFGLRNTRA